MVALEETGSTNADALKLAGEGAPHGTVVVADTQTAGRGRMGRSWWSEPGTTLVASVILRPESPPDEWTLVPLACGVAAADAIRRATDLDVSLKWPNDVVRGGKKMGGILVEALPPDVAVAGIGVNLAPAIPAELMATATSIEREGGAVPDRAPLLAAILEDLDTRLRAGDVVARYRLMCSTLGREVRIERAAGQTLTGVARDVDDRGALLVESADGEVAVSAGEVVYLRPAGEERP